MSKTFRSWDMEQPLQFAPSARALVPAEHVAHLVRDTVHESLDLSPILAAYREGRACPTSLTPLGDPVVTGTSYPIPVGACWQSGVVCPDFPCGRSEMPPRGAGRHTGG